jgi:hypothetical protein
VHALWPTKQDKDIIRNTNRNKILCTDNKHTKAFDMDFTEYLYAISGVSEDAKKKMFFNFTDVLYYINPDELLHLVKEGFSGHVGSGAMHVFCSNGDITVNETVLGKVKVYGTEVIMNVEGNSIPYKHGHYYDDLYFNDSFTVGTYKGQQLKIIKKAEYKCGATKYIEFDMIVTAFNEAHDDRKYLETNEDKPVYNPKTKKVEGQQYIDGTGTFLVEGSTNIRDGPGGKKIAFTNIKGHLYAKIFQAKDSSIFNWGTFNRTRMN